MSSSRIVSFPIIAILFSSLMLSSASISAQDSAVYHWKVNAKKLDASRYVLTLSTGKQGDWYIYAPNQTLLDVPAVSLRFVDSAVQVEALTGLGSTVVKDQKIGIFDNQSFKVNPSDVQWTFTISIPCDAPGKLQGELNYNYGKGDEFYPATAPFTAVLDAGKPESGGRILISSIDIKHPQADCGDTVTKDSYLTIFLFGLLGGIVALFTPCVFPLIPLTVSYFTGKKSKPGKGKANAILYGFFIFMIYVGITIPFHLAGSTNAGILNNISTNVWLNLLFFIIFVVFALSFFGLFEITLPSSFANKADSKSGLGNIAGIFFMALTLAIVSFSCTGPILGTLLVNVSGGGAWPLTFGAAGFGIALGLPFALFALFPRWLNSIPKSGGWMTDLKVVLGFVEVALAIKFLANADNVQQWGLLRRELFIGIWIVVGVLIVLYLIGLIRIGHSTKPKKFAPLRIFFIVLFGLFTLYLVPGLTNTRWARLSLISGFPPPFSYSLYKPSVNAERPLLDYEAALKLSRETHKPILIDFTGWACVNCRRMEEKVWTDPQVEKLMKQDYILVSLYVDERTKLPAAERMVYTSKSGSERSIQTVGDKWAAFQIENFDATAQPQYAIVSTDEKALVKTKFYTPDAKEFAEWLKCGLEAAKRK